MRSLIFLLILFSLGACTVAPTKKAPDSLQYFDLKGFVDKEAKKLNQRNPQIAKTVIINQSSEQKKLKIADWHKELSAFSDADINKSAWQGLFKMQKGRNSEIFTSDADKVPVKKLTVWYKNGQPYGIDILVKTTNILYTSIDTLTFYPDSLYQVKKTQQIKLLSKKRYEINVNFK